MNAGKDCISGAVCISEESGLAGSRRKRGRRGSGTAPRSFSCDLSDRSKEYGTGTKTMPRISTGGNEGVAGRTMRSAGAAAFALCILLLSSIFTPASGSDTRSIPPYPRSKTRQDSEAASEAKAKKLFQLTRRENARLRWDDCLARQARLRARRMVDLRRFSHRDPATGKNPAWAMVSSCRRVRYAGENLAKGLEPAQVIHEALMESPTHKKNIVDRRFNLMGIGCHKDICVELFAGT